MELILLSRFIIDLLFWTYLFSSISAEVNYWLTYLVQISKGKANITYIKKASNTNNLISTAVGRQKDLNRVSEIMFWTCTLLKVSKSQNKFMKSLVLPKNERNIARISALTFRAEILAIFRSFFGSNDDFINLFWDLLAFRINCI